MAQNDFPQRLLVAIGGDVMHPADLRATPDEEWTAAAAVAEALLPAILACPEIVITHGNAPALSKMLLRQFHARDAVTPMRLDECMADSQGGMGYLLMQAIGNALAGAGQRRPVTCLLTEVEVDAADPAFAAPGVLIGPSFSDDKARALSADGWQMREDAGHGWRIAVPAPAPRSIVDVGAIRSVLRAGHVAIAAGGGGIPVVRSAEGRRRGVQALIDKDLTSVLLARALGIDWMLILTSVPRVAIRYRQPAERWLDAVHAGRLRHHLAQGAFGEGGMATKMAAALGFLDMGGQRVIVAHPDDAMTALRGEAGTQILPG